MRKIAINSIVLCAALLAASAMLALQRLPLPVVYWLDDSRAFGTLRPRRQDSGAVR